MITLPCLIVVPEHANALHDVGQRILVLVLRSTHRAGNPPDAKLDERVIAFWWRSRSRSTAFMLEFIPTRELVVNYSNA
jgi:hypothetical protein